MNIFKQIKSLATETSKSFGSLEDWYITAVRAEGIKDKDTFSKSDPYLKIDFGGKHVKTRYINNDRTPTWNETFHFQLGSGSSKDIRITLMDSDIGFDDTIGTATISKADLPVVSGEEKYIKVPVYRKEQISGLVHLRIKRISANSSESSNVSSTYSQSQIPSQSHYPNLPQQPQNFSSSNQYQSYNTPNYNMPPPIYNQPPSMYNQSQYQQPQYQQPQYQQPPIYQQPQYNQSQYSQPYNQPYNAPPQSYNAPYNPQQGPYQQQTGPMNQQPHMNMPPQTNYPPNNYGDQYQQRRY